MSTDAVFSLLVTSVSPKLAQWVHAHTAEVRAAVSRVPATPNVARFAQKQVYFVRKALAIWDRDMRALSPEHHKGMYSAADAPEIAATIFRHAMGTEPFRALGIDVARAAELLAGLLAAEQAQEPQGTVLWTTAPPAYDFASVWRSQDKATALGHIYTRIVVRDTPQSAHEVQHQISRYMSGGHGTMTAAEMQQEQQLAAQKAALEPQRAEFLALRAAVVQAARKLAYKRDAGMAHWMPGVDVHAVYDPKLGRSVYVPDETPYDLPGARAILNDARERFQRTSAAARREFDPARALEGDISALLMIAEHKAKRENTAQAAAERAKAQALAEEQRHTRRAEGEGIHKGAYLVEARRIVGLVTAWPPRAGLITTNMGPVSMFAGKQYRDLSGRDLPFTVPVSVLKHTPGEDINEVVWNGQRFFLWSNFGDVQVATAAGRKLPADSEIAAAVRVSQTHPWDRTLDEAVANLAQTHSLQDWTAFTVRIFSKQHDMAAIAPTRRGKGLVGFRVRYNGDIYQRMADPKGGFLWVRQP